MRQVALLVARMILASLLGGDADAPQLPGEHLIWSNRAGWVFEAPLTLRAEPYERVAECPVCGDSRQGALSAEEEEALAQREERMRAAERMAPAVTLLGGE